MSGRAAAELVAQRGNGAEFPENSLPGLHSALQLGVAKLFIETQLSRDAEPFALRDADLLRTTGRPGSALDMAAVDLATLGCLEPDRFGERYADARIPRLSEIAQLLRDWPEARLFVELRRASLARHGAERCINVVLSALRDCIDRLAVVSRDLVVVELARQRGAVEVGWILPDLSPSSQIKCEALRPDYLLFAAGLTPSDSQLRHGTWRWMALDVVDGAEARRLLLAGAPLIGTPHVRALARELGLNARASAPRQD
jgi:glycerophosphoryl diester phosphodiesterase